MKKKKGGGEQDFHNAYAINRLFSYLDPDNKINKKGKDFFFWKKKKRKDQITTIVQQKKKRKEKKKEKPHQIIPPPTNLFHHQASIDSARSDSDSSVPEPMAESTLPPRVIRRLRSASSLAFGSTSADLYLKVSAL